MKRQERAPKAWWGRSPKGIHLAGLAVLGLCAASCRSPGPYGYSARYVTVSEEETATSGAREYDPVMFSRDPDVWRKQKAVLFGVVTGRSAGPGGAAYLTMSVRKLETRNLCSNANDEDTCRVTVSDRDFGVVHGLVRLKPEDDVGEKSIAAGSLVRLVGNFGEDSDTNDGMPILRASYYRHWPRHFYVTKSAAGLMRQ